MSATRQFTQTPPDKANELFERLLGTSDSAVRTRERLFAELKDELRLLATLQEEHLFPVLRRHGMQELVQEAINDNEATSVLLAEIEEMPKNSNVLLGKLTELKRVFQQHIRDDKKELLPAVLKVLSDEEAEAVVEKVEHELANVDEARTPDRRGGVRVEPASPATSGVTDTLRVGAEIATTVSRALQEAMENTIGAYSEFTRRSTGRVLAMFGGSEGETRGLQSQQSVRTKSQSGSVLEDGLQEVSRELIERSQKRLQRNIEGLNALLRCQSMADFMAIQNTLLRDNIEQSVENSCRLAELAVQITNDTARTVIVKTEKAAKPSGSARGG